MSRLNVVGRGKCLKSGEVLPEQVGGDRVSRSQLQSRYCERDLTNGLTEDTGDGLLTEIRQKAVPSISLRRPNVPHDEARKTELYSRQERECRELSKEFALMKMEEKDKENKFEIEKLKTENRRLRDKIRIDELEAKLSEAKATLTKLQARKSPDCQQITPQSRPDQQQANLYSCKVLLSGVPWTLTEKCLVRAFKRYGNIQIEWPSRRRSPSSSRDDLHIIFSSADVVTGFLSECTSRGGSWYYRISR